MKRRPMVWLILSVALALTAAACSSDDDATVDAAGETAGETTGDTTADTESTGNDDTAESGEPDDGQDATTSFAVEIWADNWMAVYVDGELIGEDSVPITTERSFNAETFTFDATYPFTIGIEAKDFMETSSGIEYIGQTNQQMGDGGLIAQITDNTSGDVVAVTNGTWATLVTQQAPLNTECEQDPDPDTTCEYLEIDPPADWSTRAFDDSDWNTATEWSVADVDPKDGYDQISWDSSAQLIWGSDLEIDNIILFRTTVGESN